MEPNLTEINRIQSYLREAARQQYDTVALPPLTLFFHPQDALKYFNYAIPDVDCQGDLSELLAQMRDLFAARGRTPRFEFFEAFAPHLPRILADNGFVEEGRQWSMLCTRESFCAMPAVPGVEVVALDAATPAEVVREFLTAQMWGFEPQRSEPLANEEVEQTLVSLQQHGLRGYLARFNGQAAAAAMFTAPLAGVCEVTGIATLEAFRRRGIAAQLTARAVQDALDLGVQTVCLTAEDERAGRVYERVGFRPFSVMLAYINETAG